MQIKVTDARMHKISTRYLDLNILGDDVGKIKNQVKEVPVADAKLVLVNADKSNLYYLKDGKLFQHTHKEIKPILVSETEKDVDECPVLCLSELEYGWKEAYRPNGRGKGATCPSCMKILAMPEHFSPKHLQAIVDGKMKDGDKVLLECLRNSTMGRNDSGYNQVYHFDSIKLNSSNHITLHKIEEKMYTREEMRIHFMKFIWKFTNIYKEDVDEYFEQNVK